ncbi:MAG: hypothetical protein QW420_06155 [Candidatus Caldarchaeum sp.]
MNLRRKKLSVTEAVRIVFHPYEREQYIPSEVLHENRVIHALLGCVNTEEVELNVEGWTITGIPDYFDDERVIEVKVQRPLTKKDEQLHEAAYQAAIYTKALSRGIRRCEVWLYVYNTQETQIYPFTTDEIDLDAFFQTLLANLELLTSMKKLSQPLKLSAENKLALKMVKKE